jgi:DNA-directed RNA polymerase subunit RPC12/RpoP
MAMHERKDLQKNQFGEELDAPSSLSFGTAKDVVSRYTHCAICGANLHFTHVTDFALNLTQETAKCPECSIRVRQVLHKLQ